ncbi:FK506-binding protein 2 precursor [Plectosphaerella plurivora]|uniref:FK506-binding protein 2 n=1 Tax=Plectosphaerella plurivora TaxID=936078 RepID=A0A9P8VHA9_9PEZI|nr:FK506-binding protein 2 precursor [Plectosphaerella plurivora]
MGFAIATAPGEDAAAAVTATAASLVQAAATAAASVAPASIKHGSGGDCQLLGPFALIVQLALGGLALLALVFKRWRERPQRPVKIWFFDVSKQVFGSVLVHIANVFMSMLTSGRFSVQAEPVAAATTTAPRWLLARAAEAAATGGYTPNPCSFYLLNLAIDTTLGIPILIGLLKVTTIVVSYTPWGKPADSIQSGNYGSPPNAWWWLKQSVIYFIGLFGMKLVVLLIFLVFPWISRVGDWALGWTEGNEQLQIFFVMMFFPLIMNALQYYVIDSFIKMATPDHERVPAEDPDWDGAAARSRDADADDLLSSDDEDAASSDGSMPLSRSTGSLKKDASRNEYDPRFDGDAPTIVGSSSSRRAEGRVKLSKDLYPKE